MTSAMPPPIAAGRERFVPVGKVAQLRHFQPVDHHWIPSLAWQPVLYSEMHLCAHYFPLAVQFRRGLPLLGIVLDERFLARRLVAENGAWQGGYLPTAVRVYPFQAAGTNTDPFEDLVVPARTSFLKPQDGIPLSDAEGAPSEHLRMLHRLSRQLTVDRQRSKAALDHLSIANLLVPILPPEGQHALPKDHWLTVDPQKFRELDSGALAAMSRQRFASVDIAVALLFSQRLLRADCRHRSHVVPSQSGAASRPVDLFGLEDVVIDDGELLSHTDLEAAFRSLHSTLPDATEVDEA
ncbi:MAG: SapC family protein [Methylacidiphilales bacterium]|nr:SapC family protein [Candidatus Methylacidiphilales bacterium]